MKRSIDCDELIEKNKFQKKIYCIDINDLFKCIQYEYLTIDNLDQMLTRVGEIRKLKSKNKKCAEIDDTINNLSCLTKSISQLMNIDPTIEIMEAIIKSSFDYCDFAKLNEKICKHSFDGQLENHMSCCENVIKIDDVSGYYMCVLLFEIKNQTIEMSYYEIPCVSEKTCDLFEEHKIFSINNDNKCENYDSDYSDYSDDSDYVESKYDWYRQDSFS